MQRLLTYDRQDARIGNNIVQVGILLVYTSTCTCIHLYIIIYPMTQQVATETNDKSSQQFQKNTITQSS